METNKMKAAMKFWKLQLQWFLIKHPFFENERENIFTPLKGLRIRFWIEGNLQIEGGFEQLNVNYNSTRLLVLATTKDNIENIFRIPWDRIVSFELIPEKGASDEVRLLLKISPYQKN